ncbi:MAG: GAF domain-containing protein, partial [Gammaproteobacteria bacterium]
MLVPPLDDGETVRLCSLQNLKVLDALPEERFDRITRLVARMFDVPVALVSLVESDRQWLKSEHGFEVDQSDGLISFCDHPIFREESFAVHDTSQDSRFANTPLAVGEQTIRFCAGQSVHSPGGMRAGTLCLIDYKPRYFSEAEAESLKEFAEMVDHEMSLLAQTTSDELTRVANRRGFIQIATSMLTLCQRQRKP